MRRLLIGLLALALHTNAATVTRYNGSRIFWDSRSPVTIFNGGYGRLIELADGRLLACCESGGIKISFSSNKGQTWTTPTLIAPNSNDTPNCVPDLIQLSDGTIIVGYNPRPSVPYTEDRHFGIRLRRSTDGGNTWSDEIFVYNADYRFENGCWEPSFLELPSGELQLYFADESPYTTSGEQQISLYRSYDGGLTWTEPQRISFRAGYRDGMPVPVLLSDKRNIVVAIEELAKQFLRQRNEQSSRPFNKSQLLPPRKRRCSLSSCPAKRRDGPFASVHLWRWRQHEDVRLRREPAGKELQGNVQALLSGHERLLVELVGRYRYGYRGCCWRARRQDCHGERLPHETVPGTLWDTQNRRSVLLCRHLFQPSGPTDSDGQRNGNLLLYRFRLRPRQPLHDLPRLSHTCSLCRTFPRRRHALC